MKTYASIGRQWVMRVLVFLLTVLLAFGGVSLGFIAWMDGYTKTQEECWQELSVRIMEAKMDNLIQEWYRVEAYGMKPEQMSADFRGKGHFRYRIQAPHGTILQSTLPQKNVATKDMVDMDTEMILYIYDRDYTVQEYDPYTYRDWYTTTEITENIDGVQKYKIFAYYAYASEIWDAFDLVNLWLLIIHPIRFALPWLLIGMLVLLFVEVIRLTIHTGHRQYLPDHPQYRGEVVHSLFDRMPYDVYMAALGGLFILCLLPVFAAGDLFHQNMVYLAVLLIVGLGGTMLVLLQAAYLTTVTRIKARTIFSNTLVWRCLKLVWKLGKMVWGWIWKILCPVFGFCWRVVKMPFQWLGRVLGAVPLFWQVAVVAPVVLFCYALVAAFMPFSWFAVFLCICGGLGLYLVILYAAYSYRTLMESGKALAEGDLRYKTNLKYLMLCFRSHGENLNRIGEGMEIAIADKIKSERFKTELITNVSHDIKTPLTSIVSYTDLLSREPLEGNAREYTEVLSRQSARLKKLIEDLIEASKASTGNIAMAPEKLDVCQIVRQSLGEYMERLENSHLQVVQMLPEEPCFAMVDGRQLWRVFDNLYANICKYAMPGTRVYIVTTAETDTVTVSMKNISRDVISMAAEDLTERFVQGDTSRATEGSGLGLNIAKSLTELQYGTFRVHCDGDLFRVDVSFPLV